MDMKKWFVCLNPLLGWKAYPAKMCPPRNRYCTAVLIVDAPTASEAEIKALALTPEI